MLFSVFAGWTNFFFLLCWEFISQLGSALGPFLWSQMKNENWILAVINGYKTFVWNHGFYGPAKKNKMNQLLTIIALMPPQNSCPVQRIQSFLAIQSFASIQACGATMSNEQQARKMLASITKTTVDFDFAGEYYAPCCAFLSGTDPSMPSKSPVDSARWTELW